MIDQNLVSEYSGVKQLTLVSSIEPLKCEHKHLHTYEDAIYKHYHCKQCVHTLSSTQAHNDLATSISLTNADEDFRIRSSMQGDNG